MKKLVALVICAFVLFAAVILWRCPLKYKAEIISASKKYGVSQTLVASVIKCESGYDKNAVSRVGAKGLMQLTDETFEWLCEIRGMENADVFDPAVNIDMGTYYLSTLIKRFGDEKTALAAYNAGPSRAENWLKNPEYAKDGALFAAPIKQTDIYMNKVMFIKQIYKYIYLLEE